MKKLLTAILLIISCIAYPQASQYETDLYYTLDSVTIIDIPAITDFEINTLKIQVDYQYMTADDDSLDIDIYGSLTKAGIEQFDTLNVSDTLMYKNAVYGASESIYYKLDVSAENIIYLRFKLTYNSSPSNTGRFRIAIKYEQ